MRVTDFGSNVFAAHYTRATTPKLMLEGQTNNKIRQFAGDYMNDPQEGRYLVDAMINAAQKCDHPLKGLFVERFEQLRDSRLLYSAYRRATFISCWTLTTIKPANRPTSDSLNHWRFYGDDGRGACLIIPVSYLASLFQGQLFHVEYGTELRGGGSGAADRPVKKFTDYLKTCLDGVSRSQNSALSQLEEVIQATHPLLFLFKSSEYESEKEVRTIEHKPNYSTVSGVLFDKRENEPPRAYVDGHESLISNGSILFYGPKSNPNYAIEAMGLAANRQIDVDVFVSSKPYR